ncbi:hypothetical protein TSUD_142900 [Trifolium subterraneum]|uniref:Uncharacterized protein n=1 Tax=Trifolium subterraneum TaxID=3900 RepID=A0A2Z6NLV4_TRISU|nr:hypothetical protein TSUD_142900 [Trifolium subterraneum]
MVNGRLTYIGCGNVWETERTIQGRNEEKEKSGWECTTFQKKDDDQFTTKHDDNLYVEEGLTEEAKPIVTLSSLENDRTCESSQLSRVHASSTIRQPIDGSERTVRAEGPWSWDWVHDRNQGNVGVIFSARKRSKKRDHTGVRLHKVGQQDPKRRKARGLLRHSLYSLKKVARLPNKDRNEDNDQMDVDDVREIGNTIVVKFKGDNVNMFIVLSRASKVKQFVSGHLQRGNTEGEKVLGLLVFYEGGGELTSCVFLSPLCRGVVGSANSLGLYKGGGSRMRGLSDHCPLILSANVEDWVPRPLRMLKCWKDIPDYDTFVRDMEFSPGVSPIQHAVVSHFASHFKATNVERSRVDNRQFKRLNSLESNSLSKPFSAAEVKATV